MLRAVEAMAAGTRTTVALFTLWMTAEPDAVLCVDGLEVTRMALEVADLGETA